MSTATDTTPVNERPSPEISQKVFTAQVHQTYTQMIIGAITNPVGALVVVVVLWPVIPQERLLVWFGVMLLIQAARLALSLRYRSIEPTRQAVTTWSRVQILVNGMSGLAWGITFFVLWPAGLPQYQIVLPVIVVGLTAGSTAGYAPVRASHLLHILLLLVPLIIRFFAEGTAVSVTLALLVMMYILTLYRIGKNLRYDSTEALTASILNEELAATLAEDKSKIEALNIELRESEERFRALSEATFEGIAIHEDGLAVDFNQAALEMFGFTEEEAIGLPVFDLIHPESRAIAIQHMQTGFDKPYEVQGIRKDGTVFSLEIQGKTIPYKGGLARVVAVRDITQRKQAETQALRLQLEQGRVQILTSFFRDASHEFRTPLAVIRMSTYLADHADDPALRRQNIDKINEQTERIIGLVDRLLLMVRLDSDIDLALMPVDMNSLLQEVAVAVDHDFPDKQVNLSYTLDSTAAPIQADAGLMHQALYALLHNAVRSVDDDGVVSVVTAQDNSHLRIVIADDGEGIDGDAIPYIFDRFYRVDKAHSTAGFGLGLPIARQIVELHRGTIDVESQAGAGATFTVTLPVGHTADENRVAG